MTGYKQDYLLSLLESKGYFSVFDVKKLYGKNGLKYIRGLELMGKCKFDLTRQIWVKNE